MTNRKVNSPYIHRGRNTRGLESPPQQVKNNNIVPNVNQMVMFDFKPHQIRELGRKNKTSASKNVIDIYYEPVKSDVTNMFNDNV